MGIAYLSKIVSSYSAMKLIRCWQLHFKLIEVVQMKLNEAHCCVIKIFQLLAPVYWSFFTQTWSNLLVCICRFIAGGLLSYTFLPFITVGSYDRRRKLVLIGISLGVAAILLTTLVLLLYVWPIQDSSVIQMLGYLNCIPITRDFCAEQNIHFNKREISITWNLC